MPADYATITQLEQHVPRVETTFRLVSDKRQIPPPPSSSTSSAQSTPQRVASRPQSPLSTPSPSTKRKFSPASDDPNPTPSKRLHTKSPARPRKTAKRSSPGSTSGGKRSRSARAQSPREDEGIFDFEYVPPSSRQRSERPFGSKEGPIPRPCLNFQDGKVDQFTASDVIEKLLPTYKSYFKNLEDPKDTTYEIRDLSFPTVKLEYPNTHAFEVFPLLVPKDPQHYNPIMELMESLEVIIRSFVSEDLHYLFGSFAQDGIIQLEDALHGGPDLLRMLRRAEHRRDGPLFQRTMEEVNNLLRDIKRGAVPSLDHGGMQISQDGPSPDATTQDTDKSEIENPCRRVVAGWKGMPVGVWKTILSETYQRCVGPSVPALKTYTPHSSETYGELEAALISDIIHECNIGPSTKLVDLGSGVGNVVLQASLQAGCSAYGIEIRTILDDLAKKQRTELEKRCRLWGVTCAEVELDHGDFRTSDQTRLKLQEADVVLVNNFKFGPDLNAALSQMFLDMREGATVVTLNPLLPKNFSISIHTMSNPLAIFKQEERDYTRGCVSWSIVGGKYFINRVDRASLAEFAKNNEEKIKQAQDRQHKYNPMARRGRRNI